MMSLDGNCSRVSFAKSFLGQLNIYCQLDIERTTQKTDEIALVDEKKMTGYHSSDIVKALRDLNMDGIDIIGDKRFEWVRTFKPLNPRCSIFLQLYSSSVERRKGKKLLRDPFSVESESADIDILYRKLPTRRACQPKLIMCSSCSRQRRSPFLVRARYTRHQASLYLCCGGAVWFGRVVWASECNSAQQAAPTWKLLGRPVRRAMISNTT